MPFDEQKLYSELSEIRTVLSISASDRRDIKESLAKLEERTEDLPLLVRDVRDLQRDVRGDSGDNGLIKKVGELEKTEIRRRATVLGIGIGSGIGGAGIIETLRRFLG